MPITTTRAGKGTAMSERAWHTSSYSANSGGGCIEVAGRDTDAAVRDSKHRRGPVLAVPRTAWSSFLTTVRSGRFDRCNT